MNRNRRSFSPDLHRRQTLARLILGGLFLLAVVGGGLVWALYGRSAAIASLLCLLGAGGVLGFLWLLLALLEKWVKDDES